MMGVNEKTYGMIGLNLPYGKETDDRIKKELGLPDDTEVYDYFYKRGLCENFFKNDHAGTYRYIMDGMSGKYVRLGLVLFESDDYNRVKYYEISPINKVGVAHTIKAVFGLDVSSEELKFFVFTHYT